MSIPPASPTPSASQPRQSIQLGKTASRLVILAFAAIIIVPIAYFMIWPSYVRSQLLKTGLQAEGTIVDISPTGNYVNNQPEARIVVDIRPEGGTPFRSETRMIINPIYAPSYQPGRNVRVRYDQNDPSKMTIEYTQSP